MYRVLLVDDEVLTREAISENVKWNELGFELCGACADGREATEYIKKSCPDLVLTDICMPHMDGLGLAKYIHENYPDIKVVIISGYDDFDYAKQALTYQVTEYILKPITSYELSEVLHRIKEKLDKENRENSNILKIQQAYNKNMPIIKERFLNHLIYGQNMKDDILVKLKEVDNMLKGKYYCVALIEEDNYAAFFKNFPKVDEMLARFAIFNVAQEIVKDAFCGLAFQNSDEKTVIIFEENSEKCLEDKAAEITGQIRAAIKEYLEIETSAIIGRSVEGLQKISQSYENAKSALEYKFMMGSNRTIFGKDIPVKKEEAPIQANKWIDRLIIAVKANQTEEMAEIVNDFFSALRSAYLSKNRIYINIQRAVLTIIMTLDETDSEENSDIMQKEKEFLINMYEQKHLEDVERDFLTFCSCVSDKLSAERDSYCKKQAVKALDYIEKNYGNHEISLNTVCTYLAMSTSYFSSVFKNVTGETFIESLTKKRMEKAKALIEGTSLKAYEIADMVGYTDPHYFSAAFKKATGFTPTEYAKKVK